MKILFCFSKNKFPNNLIALGVRATNDLGSSHCVIHDERFGLVYDFSFRGLRVFTYSQFLEKYEIKKEVSIDVEFEKPFYLLNLIRPYHKIKYGNLQLFGGLFVEIFKIRNPFSNGKAFLICNEFVLEVLRDLGFSIPSDIDSYDLDKTYQFLKNIGSKK